MMDQLREWFPNYEADLARVRRFWAGEGRFLVSLTTGQDYYRQVFDDAEIVRRAPLNLQAQSRCPGTNLPSFFVDWGTISTAKYWGGQARFDSTGGNIFIDPVAATVADGLRLAPLPCDHPEMDAPHGVRLFQQVCRELDTDALWLRSPDMQGPLNTAGLIVDQENLLMSMFDEPARVHALLERVTNFIIEYASYLRRAAGGRLCGNLWPYTFFPADLGLAFTEDLMPLLSPKLYREFGIPCLQRLADALGGLHIHCCGAYGRHVRNLAAANLPIRALEFHYPETTLEELEPLAGQVVLIPYILLNKTDRFSSVTDFYRHLIDRYAQRHRFWFACTADTPEFQAFAREYQG
jgi:hypothetical protein